jgi:hypothetical protein
VNGFVFLVCHRTVDLVAGSAATALRGAMGLGDALIALRRDDVFVVEAAEGNDPAAWAAACAARAAWFNPNTHRHALYTARAGALAAAAGSAPWPAPWLGTMAATDRPDLAGAEGRAHLGEWLALPRADGHAVSLAAWDLEDPVQRLPRGAWPDPRGRYLPLQLWTLALREQRADRVVDRALEVAVTRSRDRGLLINPHVQRWAVVAPPAPLRT